MPLIVINYGKFGENWRKDYNVCLFTLIDLIGKILRGKYWLENVFEFGNALLIFKLGKFRSHLLWC